MSSKYGDKISARHRWTLRGPDDRPRLSDHVVGGGVDGTHRWDERTPPWSVAPETAWSEGRVLDDSVRPWFANDEGVVPDEVRLFAEERDGERYVVILPKIDGCVTTVLRASQERRGERAAYLHAVADKMATQEEDDE